MRTIVLFVVAGALGCGSSSGSGGNNASPPTNHSPEVKPASASTSVVMGQSTQLSAQATDQDGDALSYSWTQTAPASPQGSFSAQTSATPTWTAPTVATVTEFTLSVTVSDGRGGTTAGTVTVYAKTSSDVSFKADVQPLFVKSCVSSCHEGTQPDGTLSLEAGKAYAQLVNVLAKRGCTTQFRVKPGEPDASVLILTMIGSTCTTRMPPNNPTYFDQASTELATVRSWIQAGAPNN